MSCPLFFLHTHVDQRVVWHNISTLCFSMCVLLSLRFHGFGAVHCESLGVRMCVLSLSSLVCFCHCWVCLFDGYAEGFLYLAVDVVLHAASKDVSSVLTPHG